MFGLCFSAEQAKGQPCGNGLVFSAILFSILLLPAPASAAARVTALSGKVEFQPRGQQKWLAAELHYLLSPGDQIQTYKKSNAVLTFDDGSKVEISASSAFTLEGAADQKAEMSLSGGKLKAWVNAALGKDFKVRTPTAVCSVRGTIFGVGVAPSGATTFEGFKGLIAVNDNKGNEILLQEGQKVGVTLEGIGRVIGLQEASAAERERDRAKLKREVGLDMSKEEILAAAANESKNAIYQQGKAMVDVNGNRVRIEEYIIRPAADQFKLVVLNSRENRFDYFYYLGTFNKATPEDLKGALRQIPGCVGAPCEFFLTKFQTGRSNTLDSVLEDASGGHLVDVNNNNVAGDEVAFAFDINTNDFTRLNTGTADTAIANPAKTANTAFFRALYDTYNLAFNGVSHHSWTRKAGVNAYDPTAGGCVGGVGSACLGVQSYGSSSGSGDQRTLTDLTNLIQPPNCDSLDNCTGTRSPGKFHEIQYLQNANGSVWEKFENYIINDQGKIIDHAAFGNITSGADFKRKLLEINFQQIVTASEFNGRKIDLVVEPKIFIESGLIP